MFIRYFATNRDRDKLGRNIERDKRIQLQKGGYHWLNMDEYLSHYLATTDDGYFPEEVYVIDSEQTVFKNFLSLKSVKRILVCVHGYNVALHETHTWFGILCKTLGYASEKNKATQLDLITDPFAPDQKLKLENDTNNLTAVVGFSWPSNGNVVSYESDRTEALASRTALANLLGRIKTLAPQAELTLLAHSMGNLLACAMLAGINDEEFQIADFKLADYRSAFENKSNQYFLDQFIMLAPDIERRQVTQCDLKTFDQQGREIIKSLYLGPYYAGLKYCVREVHNFYSRFDKALQISNTEKSIREKIENVKEFFTGENPETRYEQRLGLTEHPAAIAPPNMYSHNAVALSNREIDHSDYQDCLPVVEHLAALIKAT
ncbi:MAG: alpha/beta hydrolase [Crocinitomicaceae bacterium]|nr:alpha/beta hydrolase [Crocinitomicaceae bacterium]